MSQTFLPEEIHTSTLECMHHYDETRHKIDIEISYPPTYHDHQWNKGKKPYLWKQDNCIRPGDIVEIIDPVPFIRCGYNLNFKSSCQIAKEQTLKVLKPVQSELEKTLGCSMLTLLENISKGLGRSYLVGHKFGGNQRKLHLSHAMPEIGGAWTQVSATRICKTGERVQGYSWRSSYGENEYEPPYLKNERTHKILLCQDIKGPVKFKNSAYDYNDRLQIESTRVRKLNFQDQAAKALGFNHHNHRVIFWYQHFSNVNNGEIYHIETLIAYSCNEGIAVGKVIFSHPHHNELEIKVKKSFFLPYAEESTKARKCNVHEVKIFLRNMHLRYHYSYTIFPDAEYFKIIDKVLNAYEVATELLIEEI